MLRRSFVASSLAMAATPPALKERWAIKYYFDEEASSLEIADLQFPSTKRGIACGFISKQKNKNRPVALVSSDAGERWTLVQLKDFPISLFFLDDATGWMVGEKNLWKTEESGRSWQKITNSPKEITRVWFVTRDHGWAVGTQTQVLETNDGGATWIPVAAASQPKVNPDTTAYTVIAFAGQKDGIIAGWSDPPRHGELPSWMDPKKARDRPQWPTTTALLQTRDGGATWSPSTASIFGHLSRISIAPSGDSLGLVEFQDNFAYPSEVFLASRQSDGHNQRVFREANRFITDVLLTPGGTAYLAGVEATGTVRHSPIPGKLKVLRSTDYKNWTEMPVDYRAEAHRAILASPDEDNVWVATDTGMILKLIH